MRWVPPLSRRLLFIFILVILILIYLLYALNFCLVSNVHTAVKKNHARLLKYSAHYTSAMANLASQLFRLNARAGYRTLGGDEPVRRLPDALIIGVKKCGTRALLEFLRLHPDVRAAGSEVHFFDKFYHKGFEWYRERMPPTLAGQLTMEKTPGYWVSRSAPRRVRAMNPAVRLLVVVREPVVRAISDYTQSASKRPSLPKFEELAFVNSSVRLTAGARSVLDTSWPPLRLGLYARAYRRWLRRFPRSRILVVSGERLVVDPAAEMARVQDFLGLKRLITEKHFYFNSSKGFPCLVKAEGSAAPHCLGKTKGRSHPRVHPVALRRLRDFYRPFNERFYEMSGINFGWP